MADQKKNRKKVLVASCILAALIIGSSTFAWFSSTDEVTNRLTANSNYGVSVTESFTPPANWVPGQEINKDVAAVNTGNVDAFVKLTVTNELILTHETASAATFDADKAIELSHKAGTTTNSAGITTAVADEVTAIEAGSVLAYTDVAADTGKIGQIVVDNTLDENGNPTTVTDEFTPTGPGVYVFRRDVTGESATATGTTFTYQGYYYDGSKYYAITIGNETIGTKVDENGIFTAGNAPTIEYRQKETIVETPTLAYDSVGNKITATYAGTADPDDDIVIDINLAGGATTNWTNDGATSFYLNQILASGQTSPDLIDSVTLSPDTKNKAYISLDYDLKVALDSAQVTYDADGNVTADALAAWTYTPNVAGAPTLTWTAKAITP